MLGVHVEGLEPYANYTFSVEAQNGVSGLGSSGHASSSLSISMGHAGKEPETEKQGSQDRGPQLLGRKYMKD